MEVKIKEGFKYSTTQFADYTHRAKFQLSFTDKEDMQFDVYTTNPDKAIVENMILGNADKLYLTHRRLFSKITYWTTKAQDDLAG